MKILGTVAWTIFFTAFLLLAILLLGSLMPFMGYQIRIVQSGSMEPTLPLGSALIVLDSEDYAVDDIVTFQRVGEVEATTHRIVGEENSPDEGLMYIMRGDANNTDDQYPVAPREIAGKVVFHLPFLGFLLNFIRQPIGFAIVIGLPSLWIIYEQVVKVVKEVKKSMVVKKPEDQNTEI